MRPLRVLLRVARAGTLLLFETEERVLRALRRELRRTTRGSSTGTLACIPFRRALLLVERVERVERWLPAALLEDKASLVVVVDFFFFSPFPRFEDVLFDSAAAVSSAAAFVSALRLRDVPLLVLRSTLL